MKSDKLNKYIYDGQGILEFIFDHQEKIVHLHNTRDYINKKTAEQINKVESMQDMLDSIHTDFLIDMYKKKITIPYIMTNVFEGRELVPNNPVVNSGLNGYTLPKNTDSAELEISIKEINFKLKDEDGNYIPNSENYSKYVHYGNRYSTDSRSASANPDDLNEKPIEYETVFDIDPDSSRNCKGYLYEDIEAPKFILTIKTKNPGSNITCINGDIVSAGITEEYLETMKSNYKFINYSDNKLTVISSVPTNEIILYFNGKFERVNVADPTEVTIGGE